MKYLIFKITVIGLFVNLGLHNSTMGQTHTVNYTIQDWNASGSFTFQTGTSKNQSTNEEEGYIKIVYDDDKILEINSKKIDAIIQNLENVSAVKLKGAKNLSMVEEKNVEAINKLKELKLLLEDSDRMKKLMSKLQKNTEGSSLNWDYTIQTVDNIQTQVTGTVD